MSVVDFPTVKKKKRSLAELGVTLFHINQPEGNDEGGSDYSNTPSPHHQDLCPG